MTGGKTYNYPENNCCQCGKGKAFDSCYYEIAAPKLEVMKSMFPEANYEKVQINFRLIKSSEISVYIYGGKSRSYAREGITAANNKMEAGDSYRIGPEVGFLVLAIPEKDESETEL